MSSRKEIQRFWWNKLEGVDSGRRRKIVHEKHTSVFVHFLLIVSLLIDDHVNS